MIKAFAFFVMNQMNISFLFSWFIIFLLQVEDVIYEDAEKLADELIKTPSIWKETEQALGIFIFWIIIIQIGVKRP